MKRHPIIVIDDDPTGIQTVQDCLALTKWDVPALQRALNDKVPFFFIFANTRSLTEAEARLVITDIGIGLKTALAREDIPVKDITIISRSDSTLRSHFPLELNILEDQLGLEPDIRFLIPAFFEGNRITRKGTHYIRTGDILTPCDESEFARDRAFGYKTSFLPDYIREKYPDFKGEIVQINRELLKDGKGESLKELLENLPPGCFAPVDGEEYGDLDNLTAVLDQLSKRGKVFTFQSSASFVKSYSRTPRRELLKDLGTDRPGLILAGSHVKKTTRQLEALKKEKGLAILEMDVAEILRDSDFYLKAVLENTALLWQQGSSVLAYTSRRELHFPDRKERLAGGQKISAFLASYVQALNLPLGFLVTKGGITSHDTLAKALALESVRVLGQIEPGVPVVRLPEDHRLGAIPFVIFPGNVGDDDSLARVYSTLRGAL